jgi:hypothetical protein
MKPVSWHRATCRRHHATKSCTGPAAAPKDVKIAGMGIAVEALLHLQSQRSHALPHIGVPGRDPYPNPRRDRDHRRSDRRTAAARSGDVSADMRISMVSSSTTTAGLNGSVDGVGSGWATTAANPCITQHLTSPTVIGPAADRLPGRSRRRSRRAAIPPSPVPASAPPSRPADVQHPKLSSPDPSHRL